MKLKDADALIHDITKLYCENCEKRKGIKNGKLKFVYEIGDAPCRACLLDDMKDAIENAPTVDAEPVIRCKDCKFGKWCSYVDMNGETETVIACQAYEVQKDIDGFCDEGERRGEEDE